MLLVIAAIFCSPAGFLGGKVFDTYHSYKLAFELNSLVAAAGIFALFLRQNAGATGNEDYRRVTGSGAS